MYQNYSPCYVHLYMACFLTNSLQNARNAASDNLFFKFFLGRIPPHPPTGLRLRRSTFCGGGAHTHPPPPSKNPGYGPIEMQKDSLVRFNAPISKNFLTTS